MIVYEQEIDARMKGITQQHIDDMLLEAELSDVNSEGTPSSSGEEVVEETEEHHVDAQEYSECISPPPSSPTLTAHEEMSPTETTNALKEEDDDEKEATEDVAHPLVENGTKDDEDKRKNAAGEAEGEKTPRERTGWRTISIHGGTSSKKPKNTSPAPKKEVPPVTSNVALPEAPKYRPRRWDDIDTLLAIIVNTHFVTHPYSQVRFRRLSGKVGEYVVYHRTVGRKRLVYARILQGRLMIRQSSASSGSASSWVELRDWLVRYEREMHS
ncbi:hypothetical protein DQ04_17671000 [Trypanosoma grayi]|uniref:hypothetical protein n=1 Tax=Trypanosoma grayi TaxID=71804 RepID=UPI0004F440E0|nr:hypothetical protein DQ04_17671000 [Trypanosoma grayi]KEG05871.1 hypothetical protein DQ04_17671000 [Trypanosoma grayi]